MLRLEAGPRPQVRIEDPGPGIPAGQRARVLEPFVRVDESRFETLGGTGLGLAVALAVFRPHGGNLTFEGDAGAFAAVVVLHLEEGVSASAR